MRSRKAWLIGTGIGLFFLFFLVRAHREDTLEGLRITQAPSESNVTLRISGAPTIASPQWIDAPPPGSGMPCGRYMELTLPRLRIGSGMDALLERPLPLEQGPMRSVFLYATEAPYVVLYFWCEPATSARMRQQHSDVTIDFAKASTE